MKRIKSLRVLKKLTQSELAEKAGIAQSMLSAVENNKVNPSIKILKKIADALDVSINDLIIEFVDGELKPA
jgi:XRE family transcriptional regulator, master regulator for biofilm formation